MNRIENYFDAAQLNFIAEFSGRKKSRKSHTLKMAMKPASRSRKTAIGFSIEIG